MKTIQERRKYRTRMGIKAVSNRPRLAVFRSNKHLYLQIIDDMQKKTLLAASDRELGPGAKKQKRSEQAKSVGLLIAKKAKDAGISKVAFDRGGYSYHGNVKAAAEGAREGGLTF